MVREIVSLWLGQAGVQLGHACWELFALEHAIAPDGSFFEYNSSDDSYQHFFMMAQSGNVVPRSIFIDLEPSCIDEIKIGIYRRLFSPGNLISGVEDAANNFARGFYSSGRFIIRNVVNATRKTAESCESNAGFMVHHSFGGGTGSGFTSTLLEYLSSEYSKTPKIEFGIFPSKMFSTSIVEPYNATLALHTPMENADLACFFDNDSLYRIFHSSLDLELITYSNINKLVAQVLSGATASLRFEGPLNANIVDCQTNLVPYPRIHFPLISFCPVLSPNRMTHESGSTKEVTESVFAQENQMSTVKPLDGAYMSCVMFYRGDVSVLDVNSAISHIKKTWKIPWVDWCPTGFKIGINRQPMLPVPGSGLGYCPRALTMLCNTTAVRQTVSAINQKFWMLYDKKSFIHWYLAEGMEEHEFTEAFEDIVLLEKDYEVIENTMEGHRYSDTVPVTHVSKSSDSSSEESGEGGDTSASNNNQRSYENQSNPFSPLSNQSDPFLLNSLIQDVSPGNDPINNNVEGEVDASRESRGLRAEQDCTHVEIDDECSPILSATPSTTTTTSNLGLATKLSGTPSTTIYSPVDSPKLKVATQVEMDHPEDGGHVTTPDHTPPPPLTFNNSCQNNQNMPTPTDTPTDESNCISVEISF